MVNAFDSFKQSMDHVTSLPTMIKFHLNPTVEEFNQIINSDCELYQSEETDDKSEEFYIEYEGENWKQRKKRIKQLKEELNDRKGKPQGSHRANFCNPVILAWVHAAVTEFPWLVESCEKPLYIERAMNFHSKSYSNSLEDLIIGPVFKKDDEGKILTEHFSKIRNDWGRNVTGVIDQTIIKYCASGNKWYIDNLQSLLNEMKFKSVVCDCYGFDAEQAIQAAKEYYNKDIEFIEKYVKIL